MPRNPAPLLLRDTLQCVLVCYGSGPLVMSQRFFAGQEWGNSCVTPKQTAVC